MNPIIRFFSRASVLLLLVYLPFPAFCQSAPDNTGDLIDQLVNRMALKAQLKEAPGEIRTQFEQNPLSLPVQQNERMLELFSEAYSTDRLLEDFKSALDQQITGERASRLSQKLDEPGIQAATDALQAFYTLQGKRKRIIARYEISQEPPPRERASVIAALVDTTSAATGSVESSVVILRSVFKALGSLSEEHKFTDEQIDAVANNFRTQMQAGASRETSNRLMVIYYDVDTGILEQYAAFMQSEMGQWLDKSISQSLHAAYEAASKRFLQAVNTK